MREKAPTGKLTSAPSSASRQPASFRLLPGSKDAALVATLQPGLYSVHARGKPTVDAPLGTTGVALVEVYLVP